MKILITGGAGFIGSEIITQIYQEGSHDILVLDNLSKQIHGINPEESYLYSRIKDKCTFIKGDIREFEIVRQALAGVELVIHLAAETGTGQSMYCINSYNEINIMGTSNIFQAILLDKIPVKKVLLASSRSVYGEGRYCCNIHGDVFPESRKAENMSKGDFSLHCPYCNEALNVLPTREDSVIFPVSLYAYTKYAQEGMVKTLCNAMKIKYTIFRLQNVYGVGQSLKNPYTGILSIFSSLFLENKGINIFEDGNESRDFVHVKDIASAMIRAIENEKSDNMVINIGSGQIRTVYEIAKMLKKLYSSNSELVITGDFRIGDIAHNLADISLAKKTLGFEPQISFEEGLKEFTEWVKKQKKVNSGYEKSLNELELNGMLFRKRNK